MVVTDNADFIDRGGGACTVRSDPSVHCIALHCVALNKVMRAPRQMLCSTQQGIHPRPHA